MNSRLRVCIFCLHDQIGLVVSRVLVGPPPESAGVSGPHPADRIVVFSDFPSYLTDGQLKKECIDIISRPKFIYMHVSDVKSGKFSGTAVIEFNDKESADRAISLGIMNCRGRFVSEAEHHSLTCSDWPMLEYGPPQGVFAPQAKQPILSSVPSWAQPGRAPVTNPWQK
jgi:hypothetical protein